MIFADGSYCSDTNAAGYGVWVKFDENPSRIEGGTIFDATSSFEAEMHAVIKGLKLALWMKRNIPGVFDPCHVMIQSDSLGVLEQLKAAIPGALSSKYQDGVQVGNITTKPHKITMEAVNLVNVLRQGDQLHLRHVKGHSNREEGRYWVNRKCDSLARKSMEAHRRSITAVESV